MKKRYLIAAHPMQQAILELAATETLNELSLRKIGQKIKLGGSPQKVKHHLQTMVRYGFIDIIGGKYKVGKLLKKP